MHRAIAFIIVLCVSTILLSSSCVGQNSEKQAARLAQFLKQNPKADADGDGRLSREEFFDFRNRTESGSSKNTKSRRRGPQPTHEDVSYGDHQRHRIDIWLPEDSKNSRASRPLLLYFHGGGFVGGDKSTFDPTPYLEAGFVVASCNYRLVDGVKVFSPQPMMDCARALQFLRSKSEQYSFDPSQVVLSGNSAGAVISMWIGYHEDLANPGSSDEVSRQSTRVKCIVPLNGPTNLDPTWIRRVMGGPKQVHGSFKKMFGFEPAAELPSDRLQQVRESSPFHLVSASAPPTLLIYNGRNDVMPLPPSTSPGKLIHHPYFGQVLKQRLDELKVENELRIASDPRKNDFRDVIKWIDQQLAGTDAQPTSE